MEITITIKLTGDELNDLFKKDEQEVEEKTERHDVKASQYARFFDETCAGWTKDPESNLMFLKMQENYMNEQLRNRGYLFLNEVYRALGMPETKAGQVIGWIFDEKNPYGDNYVSFNIFDDCNANAVNGFEGKILIDPNVDGSILDRI